MHKHTAKKQLNKNKIHIDSAPLLNLQHFPTSPRTAPSTPIRASPGLIPTLRLQSAKWRPATLQCSRCRSMSQPRRWSTCWNLGPTWTVWLRTGALQPRSEAQSYQVLIWGSILTSVSQATWDAKSLLQAHSCRWQSSAACS